MNDKLTKLTHKKQQMILALEKSLGIVTTACLSVGISRESHYNWYNEDIEYKTAVDSIKDIKLDFVESQLHKNIQNGDTTAIIFALKTLGKNRGFIEKQEITQTNLNVELDAEVSAEQLRELKNKINKIDCE
jgi:hypothetical protein